MPTVPPAEDIDLPGVAVDARGGAVIDPTKNVLDLVRAESKYQDALRDLITAHQTEIREIEFRHYEAMRALQERFSQNTRDQETTYQNAMRDAESKRTDQLRHAESQRIDQLAQTRQEFSNTIRDMLAESVRTTSTLVSTQLVQIQATFDTRVSKLEAGAFTQAGKSSVADPATADSLTRMQNMIAANAASTTETMHKMASMNNEAMIKLNAAIAAIGTTEQKGQSQRMGQGQVIAWIIGAAMLMAAIATPLIAFLALRTH